MKAQARDVVADGQPNPQPLCVTILDLDRTLTRRGTYSPFLLQAAWRTAPLRLLLVPAVLACMIAYRCGLLTRKTLKEAMQRLLLGGRVPRARIEALAAGFADRILADGLHAEALPLIAKETAAGHMLVLATAAHRFYAEALAQRLGIARVVATESLWQDGCLLPKIAGENCYGPNKANAILAYLRRLGYARGDLHLRCYSDDRSDLPTFEASDERFVINPSKALAQLAHARDWTIHRFR